MGTRRAPNAEIPKALLNASRAFWFAGYLPDGPWIMRGNFFVGRDQGSQSVRSRLGHDHSIERIACPFFIGSRRNNIGER